MRFSKFKKHFTEESGIVQLMEDLGEAGTGSEDLLMLGGGKECIVLLRFGITFHPDGLN